MLAMSRSVTVISCNFTKTQQGSNAPKKCSKKNAKGEADNENPEDFVDPETPLGEKKRL